MHKFLSDLNHDEKIFIGDYDSYTIITHQLSVIKLMNITKLALLLFDYILMPAAFFWQSKEMSRLLRYLEEPISRGLILPVIRDYSSTNGIDDYFKRRVEESQKMGMLAVFQQPELASEIASTDNTITVTVNCLRNMNAYAYSDKMSVREVFTSNWVADLLENQDINSLRYLFIQSRLSVEQIKQALSTLLDEAHYPQFSRASCIEKIQKIIPPGIIQESIKNRISWLYLKSNADAYDSKFYYSYDLYNKMVFKENLSLLAQILEVLGITNALISQLSIPEILRIRNSDEFRLFISVYRKIVNSVYCEQNLIVDTLKQKLVKEIRKEKVFANVVGKLRFVQNTSASVFLGLIINFLSGSNVSSLALVTTGTLATVPSILNHFNMLNKRMNGTPLSDFKEYILTKKYQNYYQNQLRE